MAQVVNIFNFLKDYNQVSNPVVTVIDKQIWSMDLTKIPKIEEIESAFSGSEIDELTFLKVTKPILEPCPKPDDSLLEWIAKNWQEPAVDTVLYNKSLTRHKADEDGKEIEVQVKFEEDPRRIELYEEWSRKRSQWREVQAPKQEGLDLYNKLYRLYSDMKKEAEGVELIIGDGVISWKTDGQIIRHPILLQKVSLEFEPEKPRFIVKCEEIKAELYTAMLRVMSSINQKMLTSIIKEVEDNEFNVVDRLNTRGLFQRLIHVIDQRGEFVEKLGPINEHAQITISPVMFLRKRTLGYSAFLEKVIEEIEEKSEDILPSFFQTMIGNHQDEKEGPVESDEWNFSGIDKDILLTLPANNEQLKIIKYLDRYGAVLVQGPPGTGKTHTIANLIGHLLSQGKSVLVTSHKEKALTVLKDKVYKDPQNPDLNLQSLCISLLSSKSQKNEMDHAINEIAAKGTSLDENESVQTIKRLQKERAALIEKSQGNSSKLLEIRALEYKDLVYDNETISPIDAAKFIKFGENHLNIIPGKTSDDTLGFPLTGEELHTLYGSNSAISAREESLLDAKLPDFDRVWNVKDFSTLCESIAKFREIQENFDSVFDFNKRMTLNDCRNFLDEAYKLKAELESLSELQIFLFEKSVCEPAYPKLWDSVLRDFDELYKEYDQVYTITVDYDFEYDSTVKTDENLEVLDEIIATGKEVPIAMPWSLFKPKWTALRDAIKNDGRPIEKRNEFIALRTIFSYEIEKKKLIRKINKLLSDSLPKIQVDDQGFERDGIQQKESIRIALNWYKHRWEHYVERLKRFIERDDQWNERSRVNYNEPFSWLKDLLINLVIPELDYQLNMIQLRDKKVEHQKYLDYLRNYQLQNEILDQLIMSVEGLDTKAYQDGYSEIESILRKANALKRRREILEKLSSVAPLWAHEIKNRKGIHGEVEPPKDIVASWKWKQLDQQVKRLDAYDANEIQKEIHEINEKLFKNAQRLAYESAWYEKITNTTIAQTQAIEGWRTTIRQIGKGTGKKAPALMRKARELMPLCQSAIPVWIMPLNRVVENFDPQNNKFDVVIVDEASQSDILALSALYLGKKIIIVGDDEQVSPDSVGIKKDEVDALIEMHLQGVPNSHLFNGQTSLYDMAKSSGFKPLMLTEHFRCLPEIIEFSNALSYNGRIRPLRDASRVTIKPPVVEYRVKSGRRNNRKVNEIEAIHIASLVCAMVESPAYKDKTIGVISLLGTEQSYEVDRLLQAHLSPVEYERRQIQCGTSPQFQGDERDIILLSVVDSANEVGGPVRLVSEDGRNDMYRKRYNVAASRAKDQMWVVHSLNPDIDLKPDDIRLRLIKHAQNPDTSAADAKLLHAESPFEEEVMNYLLNKGYQVVPQKKVGSYRMDMVIEDGDNQVAIECDGEKWHTQDDLPNDLKRQAILERLGWRFIRIRGSAFYREPDKTMENVVSELDKYGIRPDYSKESARCTLNNGYDFSQVDELKVRASEIRRVWFPDKFVDEILNYVDPEMILIDEKKNSSKELMEKKVDLPILEALDNKNPTPTVRQMIKKPKKVVVKYNNITIEEKEELETQKSSLLAKQAISQQELPIIDLLNQLETEIDFPEEAFDESKIRRKGSEDRGVVEEFPMVDLLNQLETEIDFPEEAFDESYNIIRDAGLIFVEEEKVKDNRILTSGQNNHTFDFRKDHIEQSKRVQKNEESGFRAEEKIPEGLTKKKTADRSFDNRSTNKPRFDFRTRK